MNIEQFKLLKEKFESDLELNEDNVMEKSLKFSSLYSKCLNFYLQEVKILKTILIEKDKVYGELYHKFKFNPDKEPQYNYTLDSHKELDIYVKSHDDYYKKALQYQNQELIVKYLEETLKNIDSTGYRIKNFIEFKKLGMSV